MLLLGLGQLAIMLLGCVVILASSDFATARAVTPIHAFGAANTLGRADGKRLT